MKVLAMDLNPHETFFCKKNLQYMQEIPHVISIFLVVVYSFQTLCSLLVVFYD